MVHSVLSVHSMGTRFPLQLAQTSFLNPVNLLFEAEMSLAVLLNFDKWQKNSILLKSVNFCDVFLDFFQDSFSFHTTFLWNLFLQFSFYINFLHCFLNFQWPNVKIKKLMQTFKKMLVYVIHIPLQWTTFSW